MDELGALNRLKEIDGALRVQAHRQFGRLALGRVLVPEEPFGFCERSEKEIGIHAPDLA
jgi:hypothetical protein